MVLDEASPLVVVELAGNGVPLADLRAAEAARCADLVGAYDDAAAVAAGRARGAFVVTPCVEIKFYGAFVLNRRVVLHAIDASLARWRGGTRRTD